MDLACTGRLSKVEEPASSPRCSAKLTRLNKAHPQPHFPFRTLRPLDATAARDPLPHSHSLPHSLKAFP